MTTQEELSIILRQYTRHKPLFMSLIRAKEAVLFKTYYMPSAPSLDVGCGDGFFATQAFGHIDVGIDLVGSRMNEARQLGVYGACLPFDGVHIPYKDGYFSRIVSNCVLEHVEHIDRLLAEVRRVVKKRGVVYATVMSKPWEDHLFGTKILGKRYAAYMRNKQIHRNLFTYTQWKRTFERAGFGVERAVGYLTPLQCSVIDICHYISVPSLISYTLTGKWVLVPQLAWYPISYLARLMEEVERVSRSGAIFFVLKPV